LEVMVDGVGAGGTGTGAVAFEDATAAAEHLGQLKPLGLNCLLNSNAQAQQHALAVEETLRTMAARHPHGGHPRSVPRGRGDALAGLASCDTADASRMLAPVRTPSGPRGRLGKANPVRWYAGPLRTMAHRQV
jgi:hypothetical protein